MSTAIKMAMSTDNSQQLNQASKNPASIPRLEHSAFFFLLAVYAAGLFISLKTTLTLFGFDPDAAHSIMLWHGLQKHGFGWIQTWQFTPDNWLFSLVPIHFFEFLILGPRPTLVIYTGWAIFAASSIIPALIARDLGLKASVFILPVIFASLGFYAYQSGFISYATSHNTTNLLGLLFLLSIIKLQKTQKRYFALPIFALGAAGGLSDPWMLPTYILPGALATLALLLTPSSKANRANNLLSLSSIIFTVILLETKGFGALTFIPPLHFALGNWPTINSNAIFLVKDLGGLVNIIPGQDSNFFLPSLVSLIAIGSLYWTCLRLIKLADDNNSNLALQAFTLFSVGGVALAFLISDLLAADYSARFLINVVYLGFLAIAASVERNWTHLSFLLKSFVVIVLCLFISAGFLSNFKSAARPGFSISSPQPLQLLSFLDAHNLHRGYGPYWGSQANAVTVLSNWQTVIRPVVFDNTTGKIIFGNRPETSLDWYKSSVFNDSRERARYFVVATNDGENCADLALCINGLTLQYGKPAETLKYQNSFILVWDHSLVNWRSNSYKKVSFSDPILFNSHNNSLPSWSGWSSPEAWGTWSNGQAANILLQLTTMPTADVNLIIRGQAFTPKQHSSQKIDMFVNGKFVKRLVYARMPHDQVRVIEIPKKLILDYGGRMDIKFFFRDPVSPASLSLSSDRRQLGLGLMSVEVKPSI